MEIGPLGVPQPPETSCERCRNLELECIVERTSLGRPTGKANQRKAPQSQRSASLKDPDQKECDVASALSDLEINEHLFSKGEDANSPLNNGNDQSPQPAKKTVFRSMTEVNAFMSSVLEKDARFGSEITHATTRWRGSLSDLVSKDMTILLDTYLSWHRFLLPKLPTLADLRNRLISEESSAGNHATSLLFAILCLTSFDTAEGFSKQYPKLKQSLQHAVSSYGQEFTICPPTHSDSITVCLFLIEFRPTMLSTSQFVAYKAVSPGIYINLAYRIAQRLSLLPAPDTSIFHQLINPQAPNFERCFANSVQELRILSLECCLDGYLAQPLPKMRRLIQHIQPHINAYQHLLHQRECSPRVVFHIQWNMSFYLMIEGLINAKQCWSTPERLFLVVEDMERKCFEQINVSNCLLVDPSSQGDLEDIPAARSLLEMKFHRVFAGICGLGLFYAAVQRKRLFEGENIEDPEVHPKESLYIVDQVAESVNSPPNAPGQAFSVFLQRFGTSYPDQLVRVLEAFLECAESKLGGITFKAPVQQVLYEIIFVCKNIVENNLVQVRVFGRLARNFETQMDVFPRCASYIGQMAASPWTSTNSAFATGCVYAAGSKIIYAFHNILERLREEVAKGAQCDGNLELFHTPPDLSDCSSMGMDFDNCSWDAWNLWPHVGSLSPFETSLEHFDLVPELNWDNLNYDSYSEPLNLYGM
ncbi:hypothetical protein N7452_009625 [Penicillium brevicompactum]|uniref:Uncharacterized protein n=1 Tax=Penicillium brevicompactum TaxID=5074 RepID=A0A9W9Q906_PENBR|nr:hypothetical protein N7452_009625 [Penicillium brevicompactum]